VSPRTFALTTAAMLAFAGNTLLCRAALGSGLIDAASFMTLRVVSGAIILALIVLPRRRIAAPGAADFKAAAALLVYMVGFSFAYLSLNSGTGALILFGAVQVTMLAWSIRRGERQSAIAWFGYIIAIAGLVWLVAPGLEAPDPIGSSLMAVAGIAWGAYSLIGRGSKDPTTSTAASFALAVPAVLAVSAVAYGQMSLTPAGVVLAVASGAITSGLGYAIWYAVLPRLSTAHAASVQLTVPALASALGIVLLAEPLSLRLVSASVATIGGVAIVIAARAARSDNR
jgi:drug/metabolite transporter (DMT)-like permease